MPKFRSIPRVIDAEQFVDPAHPPRGVLTHEIWDGCHYVSPAQGTRVPVEVGEWIVAEKDGQHFYPIAASEFRSLYEPV